ncbi:serine/threonine-protein kinase [Streptomyces sp. RFCAC02]|uniref:serine/threonine-protein kinase n=1 Tax=Streptomyces sp. RFCAC02 TaxID=2499143 RepID=UPI001F10C867|nr:serine/threonine-protein kinase [Streptomyces sp. RFCAC02]
MTEPGSGPPPADQVRPLQPQDPREVAGHALHGRLGTGGMGTVYFATAPDGRPVALKLVHTQLAEDPLFRRRFEHEVRAARRVHGRFLVPPVASDTDAAVPWLATAYVPGPSLLTAVAAHGPLPQDAVVRLTAGVAEALATIHAAGVVHRDLKPGNVLLAADGPAVIDFGIARAADATSLTSAESRVGTPAFMAPEQIVGHGSVTAAVDVFALGLTAAFAAAGSHPFGEGATPALLYRIINEEPDLGGCPAGLRDLIGACLAKDPGDRPAPAAVVESCRELAGTMGLPDHLPGTGWLPARLVATAAPPPVAPAPALPPHYPPHILSAPVPGPLTTVSPHRPATRPGGRRDGRRAALAALGTVTAAVLAVVLTAVLTSGGGSDDDRAAQDDLSLTSSPPSWTPDPEPPTADRTTPEPDPETETETEPETEPETESEPEPDPTTEEAAEEPPPDDDARDTPDNTPAGIEILSFVTLYDDSCACEVGYAEIGVDGIDADSWVVVDWYLDGTFQDVRISDDLAGPSEFVALEYPYPTDDCFLTYSIEATLYPSGLSATADYSACADFPPPLLD